jgi:hypothetical protein
MVALPPAPDGCIPIAELLGKFISHSFNEIFKLLEEDSGSDTQNRSLMRILHAIYVLGTKLRMTILFDDKYRHSQELLAYLQDSSQYDAGLVQFADELFNLWQQLNEQILVMFDIEGAIDLLVGNCKTRFPASIFPKRPKFSGDPAPFFALTHNILKVKLMSAELPANSRVRLNRGRVILTIPDSYRLYFSVHEPNGPFVASRLAFLLPSTVVASDLRDSLSVMRTKGRDLRVNQVLFQRNIRRTLAHVNSLFAQNAPLLEVDRLLQRVIALFEFTRLFREGRRIWRAATAGSVDFRCRKLANGPLCCEFWQSPDESFRIVLRQAAIDVVARDQVLGSARGRPLEEILEDCMRRAAVRRLKSLQERLESDGAQGCEICTEADIPFLAVYGEKIVCIADGGGFAIAGRPGAFPASLAGFVRTLKLADEIRTHEAQPRTRL